MPAAVRIEFRLSVVQKQRLAIPIEPEVLVLRLFVELLIELLDNGNHISVEGPEAELRSLVAFLAHLHHGREGDFPLIPVKNGISDVHHKDIHSCISEHGHILADNPLVLAEEVTVLRLAPVIGAKFPVRMVCNHSRTRILLENFGNIAFIRLWEILQSLGVPGNVEYADDAAVVILDRSDFFIAGHCSTKGIGCDPCVCHQVSCIAIINGVLHRCSTGHY